MERLQAAERLWPGFLAARGPTLVHSGVIEIWNTRIRWQNLESWLAWMDSEQRRTILQQATAQGFSFQGRTNWQGYARWLNQPLAARTPIWKMNLVVLAMIYPTVMVVARISRDWSLQRPIATLLANAITVAVTGWWLIPLLARLYGGWLEGRWSRPRQRLALVSILLLLAGFLLLFSLLPPGGL